MKWTTCIAKVILEHYKNPVHRGELDVHNHDFEDENPL
jgi:NifU-like protein involved in Fe-S cluster formation